MNRLRTLLFDLRLWLLLGLATLAAYGLARGAAFETAPVHAAVALAALVGAWAAVRLLRRVQVRRSSSPLGHAADETPAAAAASGPAGGALAARLLAALQTIRTSKLGDATGSGALYGLPWFLVIGEPGAGKSTAIARSGLAFPVAPVAADERGGDAGTRDCDWHFTSHGILLDTAGRYAVREEDRPEWLGLLGLLKKHRPKAPINGVVIVASVAELSYAQPDAALPLARKLRQRLQEVTEKLEVVAPVYLVFTHTDRVPGFAEMYAHLGRAERERVWGATFACDADSQGDAGALFATHFDALHDGIRELALARLSQTLATAPPTGVLSFPLEFASLKPSLHAFVATLFEDNPYQLRPLFRGFYFTSAVQDVRATVGAGDRVAQRFALGPRAERATAREAEDRGFFLKDLCTHVIFADRDLVRPFVSRGKTNARARTVAVAIGLLAAALGGWSWSYLNNRQLLSEVRVDLEMAVKLQRDRVDLASRLEALELLQDRIEQLGAWHARHPLAVGLGLYQGDAIERKLREEYFAGVREVMLQPVARSLEAFLGDVNANAANLRPMPRAPVSVAPSAAAGTADTTDNAATAATAATAAAAGTPGSTGGTPRPASTRFAQASPDSVEDAYNALKTYLMLADRPHAEAGHLTDQITRFWRGWLDEHRGAMPNEQMIRSAERMISFAISNLGDPAFPVLAANLGLVDQTREHLRRVARGMPARERVYADIKARAATRFAPVTVARIVGDGDRQVVAGSHVVPGTYTREAWHGYVDAAFRDAATKELQSVDWVLKTSAADDLSLQGSPDQIRKALTDLYKADYVREWQRFMQGITVAGFGSFDGAVKQMNRLGDPADSPVMKLMAALLEQTSWDNPSPLAERLAQGERGVVDWFRQTVLRQIPGPVVVDVHLGATPAERPTGPIGREFAALARIVAPREQGPSPLNGYLQTLSKLRSRFNQVKGQGEVGPGARQMMADTFATGSSELGDALKFVDEQVLVGMSESARGALRPLFVRPLVESFAMIVPSTESELNRVWAAQVLEPFRRTLASKYPFDAAAKIEATSQDIATIFGPSGAIAKFAGEALGPLVVRRGDTITPRAWAEMGVRLRPEFSARLATWVAPLDGTGASGGNPPADGAAGAARAMQWSFEMLPIDAPALDAYTIEIDGQVLRHAHGTPAWTPFVWPNDKGAQGARIRAVTLDGRTVEIVDEPGPSSLSRLFDAATRTKLADGVFRLGWTKDGHSVTAQLRIVHAPGAGATGDAAAAHVASTLASTPRDAPLPTRVAGIDAATPTDAREPGPPNPVTTKYAVQAAAR